ncbi:hypothetical protein [Streptomyces sp. 8N706]|uniref:hypothetical protein n=1 Tax=Streptomyces sp. 8N706 TaxID=3457416 RepID=UPI003FD3C73B
MDTEQQATNRVSDAEGVETGRSALAKASVLMGAVGTLLAGAAAIIAAFSGGENAPSVDVDSTGGPPGSAAASSLPLLTESAGPSRGAEQSAAQTQAGSVVDRSSIDLPDEYALNLSDSPLRPVAHENGNPRDVELVNGKFMTLNGAEFAYARPGRELSYAECANNTRYIRWRYIDEISKGDQICVKSQDGLVAGIRITDVSVDVESRRLGLDLTLWVGEA